MGERKNGKLHQVARPQHRIQSSTGKSNSNFAWLSAWESPSWMLWCSATMTARRSARIAFQSLGAALPDVTFHACRHSHASALIAAGIDVVSVSRRLGHSSPVITLGTYAHLFQNTDTRAAEAIEKVLK